VGHRKEHMLNLTLSISLMAILLVPIGEIDQKVIQVLKDDLNKVFKKQVVIGKGMTEPDYAYDHKRKQYFSKAILNAIMEQKEYAAYGAPRASP
jgi:predicted Zn-dependent protease